MRPAGTSVLLRSENMSREAAKPTRTRDRIESILYAFEALASKLGPTDLVCLVREVRALSALVHTQQTGDS
jgi:hypothetical protein